MARLFNPSERRIWIHCASLGEFEQGRPLIEAFKKQHPEYKIVLTFFSPSGYEVRKDYDQADYVLYLPMDSRKNAKRFLEIINPSLAIFVKYEFWYHYLNTLKQKQTPTILVAAAFRKEQAFFKWYGGLFRKILNCYNYIFVQDKTSADLLENIQLKKNVIIAGDTRYDRVAAIAKTAQNYPLISHFQGNAKLLIAGSTWPDDEQLLKSCFHILPTDWKIILAPHEINKSHIQQILSLYGNDAILYSQLDINHHPQQKILIIDNIGMLSSLFRYGQIAYIGGGFQKGGIHNTLEPAVFGLPVLFGPVYKKFVEANLLVANEFAFPVNNSLECEQILRQLTTNEERLHNLQAALKSYIQENIGATDKIMSAIHPLIR